MWDSPWNEQQKMEINYIRVVDRTLICCLASAGFNREIFVCRYTASHWICCAEFNWTRTFLWNNLLALPFLMVHMGIDKQQTYPNMGSTWRYQQNPTYVLIVPKLHIFGNVHKAARVGCQQSHLYTHVLSYILCCWKLILTLFWERQQGRDTFLSSFRGRGFKQHRPNLHWWTSRIVEGLLLP